MTGALQSLMQLLSRLNYNQTVLIGQLNWDWLQPSIWWFLNLFVTLSTRPRWLSHQLAQIIHFFFNDGFMHILNRQTPFRCSELRGVITPGFLITIQKVFMHAIWPGQRQGQQVLMLTRWLSEYKETNVPHLSKKHDLRIFCHYKKFKWPEEI